MTKIKVLLLTSSVLFLSCKSQIKKDAMKEMPEKSSSEISQNFSEEVNLKLTESIKKVQNEPLTVDQEYKAFKNAINAYKKSLAYVAPLNDEDKQLKELIDASDLLTKERVLQLIKEKKFAIYEERIKNLPQIQKQANNIMKIESENDGLQLAEEKTGLQQGTGIALIVVGSLGVLQAGSSAIAGSRLGAGIGLAFAVWPLIVGALIVANEAPNSETIQAAQGFLGTSSAIFGILTLGVGAGAYLLKQNRLPKEEEGISSAGKIGVFLLGGITAALAVWTAELALAEDLTPQQLVLSKVGRFYYACQEIERRSKT